MSEPKILVIRRDNIGDLVCTTPLIAALRRRFPDGHIAAMVNTYNRDVLDGNPDLNAVFAYAKVKHLEEGESHLASYLARIRLFLHLRASRFDYAILAGSGYQRHALQFARWARARHVVGFVESGKDSGIDLPVAYGNGRSLHEVEDVFRLGGPLGITANDIPPLRVCADGAAVSRVRDALLEAGKNGGGPLIAVHISARKPSQRWPVSHFAETLRRLHARYRARFILLWAPGEETNPRHPGDDGKARELRNQVADLPVLRWPTGQLGELIAALSLADVVLCADGGAMHLAAGLGRPIVCLFGDSPPARWHPWGVPHVVMQPPSREVGDVSAEAVEQAIAGLLPV